MRRGSGQASTVFRKGKPMNIAFLPAAGMALLLLAPAGAALAEEPLPQARGSVVAAVADWFGHWYDRVDAARASQPHWMIPIATTPPFLAEVVRYDQVWQHQGNGADLRIFNQNGSIRFIPTETSEIDILLPTYQERSVVKPAEGFAAWPFIAYKQRLLSANEENGNHVVSFYLVAQAPTGVNAFPNHDYVITPSLLAGKGWGNFNIQTQFGAAIPLSHDVNAGTSLITNVVLQYNLFKYFWPEFELNDTWWAEGPREGKNQVILTPGIVFGQFPIAGRLKTHFGFGYQFAIDPDYTVTKRKTVNVITPTFNNAWILTARLAF